MRLQCQGSRGDPPYPVMSSGSPAGLHVLCARSACLAGSGCSGAPCPGDRCRGLGWSRAWEEAPCANAPMFAEPSARAGPGLRGGGGGKTSPMSPSRPARSRITRRLSLIAVSVDHGKWPVTSGA